MCAYNVFQFVHGYFYTTRWVFLMMSIFLNCSLCNSCVITFMTNVVCFLMSSCYVLWIRAPRYPRDITLETSCYHWYVFFISQVVVFTSGHPYGPIWTHMDPYGPVCTHIPFYIVSYMSILLFLDCVYMILGCSIHAF